MNATVQDRPAPGTNRVDAKYIEIQGAVQALRGISLSLTPGLAWRQGGTEIGVSLTGHKPDRRAAARAHSPKKMAGLCHTLGSRRALMSVRESRILNLSLGGAR